jgi:hypothetical protein
MIADDRADAFMAAFTGQWLQLRNLDKVTPDVLLFPDFDDNVRQAMRRETELLFASIVRENRPATTLLDADYTFVNERLARHYGIPKVCGSHFRRVPVTDALSSGLLGHASILSMTAANRTSPVLREMHHLELVEHAAAATAGGRADQRARRRIGRRPFANSSSGTAPTRRAAPAIATSIRLALPSRTSTPSDSGARSPGKGSRLIPPACSPTDRRSMARSRCGKRCCPGRMCSQGPSPRSC